MFTTLSVVVVVALSLLVTRVATVALTLTGLSREAARFQARSALTGSGFTTSESESVVNHPVRRRIVMMLMLVGSAGIVTVLGTTALSYATARARGETLTATLVLVAGLLLLLWVASSKTIDRALQPVILRALQRYTDIDARDYAALLHVAGDFAVTEMAVDGDDWLADAELKDLRLSDEGVLVLGVQRADGVTYVGAPKGFTTVFPGDVLILYGHVDRITELDQRRRSDGAHAHMRAVLEQRQLYAEARRVEEARARLDSSALPPPPAVPPPTA